MSRQAAPTLTPRTWLRPWGLWFGVMVNAIARHGLLTVASHGAIDD